MVPTAIAATALHQRSSAQTRIATSARHGQRPARAASAGWFDPRPTPPQTKTAKVACSVRHFARPAPDRRRPGDLHSAGDHPWQHSSARSDLQGYQTAERSVRQGRARYTTGTTDYLRPGPHHQTLALSVPETVTD